MKKDEIIYDVAVVGGGPAGMMTAGRAAELGAEVILIEKNESLGKKLLITGGGRCNLTNAEFDTRKFLEKFREDGKFLFSSFSQFGVKETLEFFHELGVETKIEDERRVFPASNKAQTIFNALLKYIKKNKVEIILNSPVVDILTSKLKFRNVSDCHSRAGGNPDSINAGHDSLFQRNDRVCGVKLKNGKEILARKIVIATGGTSHPETGSTGEGFKWLKKLGHSVIDNNFALVPIALKDEWVKKLSGLTLKDIKLTTFKNGHKYMEQTGKLLFTHFGISGPTVLNMSKDIGELIKYSRDPEYFKGSEDIISLDLFPRLDPQTLKQKLHALLTTESNKKLKNTLGQIIPSALVPVVLKIANIDGETSNHSIKKEDRAKLIMLMKNIPLHIKNLLGKDKAIVSSGGVKLDEVDFKTMGSRLFPNLYLIGDILNIDRPSGGYSLQLCWTTGFVAGNSASKWTG